MIAILLPVTLEIIENKMPVSKKAGSQIVTVDRRTQNRRIKEASEAEVKAMVAAERRKDKVQRRRQIDPTTCERDYSNDEVEFMKALEQYKRTSGRMFPTCSEILEVIRGLGYVKNSTSSQIEATAEALEQQLDSLVEGKSDSAKS
jgi:UDP-N-acetylmuramoylalanine-D-glutamate ligase